MKRCPMCKKHIELDKWPTYKNKRSSYCRDCKRIFQREWIRAKRESIRKQEKM